MNANFYRVGGCVRDAIMGIESKDIDFSVEAGSYDEMKAAIIARGCDIKVEKPEFFTIRAVDKVLGGVDFVMCRKEGAYSDGRRPDSVENGTLYDDLARRDFTMNAIAQDDNGGIIDPFGGQNAINEKVIRCVGRAEDRIREDSLRLLRCVRFSVTKNFVIAEDLERILHDPQYINLLGNVSFERTREELFKMFKHDTLRSLQVLEAFPLLRDKVFEDNRLWLIPTSKA